MKEEYKMNGRSLKDFESSYVLTYLFERALSEFGSLNDEGKKGLARKYDDLISELFDVDKANVVFEEKEMTDELNNIYMGEIEEIKSGAEFIFRYFFAKRQQYQRICIANNDQKDFTNDEFLSIKESLNETPITGKKAYRPYSSGLANYLVNYNKVDALMFAFSELATVYSIIDFKRVCSNMSIRDSFALISSYKRIERRVKKIMELLGKFVKDPKYQKRMIRKHNKFYDTAEDEKEFLKYIQEKVDEDWNNSDYQHSYVLLMFHENVWKNLDDAKRRLAVEMANEIIGAFFLKDMEKELVFVEDKNVNPFNDDNHIEVGNLATTKPHKILQQLVCSYSVSQSYGCLFMLPGEGSLVMLDDYIECKSIYEKTGDLEKIKEHPFMECVMDTSSNLLRRIYRYIDNNLVICGSKVRMPMSKEEFCSFTNVMKKRR